MIIRCAYSFLHTDSPQSLGLKGFFVLRTSECNIFRVHDGLVIRCPDPEIPVSCQRDGSLLGRAMTASQSALLKELTGLAGHSVSSALWFLRYKKRNSYVNWPPV